MAEGFLGLARVFTRSHRPIHSQLLIGKEPPSFIHAVANVRQHIGGEHRSTTLPPCWTGRVSFRGQHGSCNTAAVQRIILAGGSRTPAGSDVQEARWPPRRRVLPPRNLHPPGW